MGHSVVYGKSLNFALRIVKAYQYLNDEKGERILSKQLLRSGTAIGAMVCEAEFAESASDFIHKPEEKAGREDITFPPTSIFNLRL